MVASCDVSVLVRVRDERDALDQLLAHLAQQTFHGSFEVVVIDNDSEDGSAHVALAHSARVFSLPRRLFTYGRAINVGVGRCRGDFIVLLSAHAWPQDKTWLQSIVEALRSSTNIDAAFCAQIPKPPIGKHEEFRFSTFSKNSYVLDGEFVCRGLEQSLSLYEASYFSNSACIIRREAMKLSPMRDLPYAEENAFALDCIMRGRVVAYLSAPAVYYKGPISWKRLYEQARRQMIAERLIEEFYGPSFALKRRRFRGAVRGAVRAISIPFMLIGISYRMLVDERYRLGSRALIYDLCAIGGVWGRLIGALTWQRYRKTMSVDQDSLQQAEAALREVGQSGLLS
jgi:glycosyltransferase involved in cell wall biosynthesis